MTLSVCFWQHLISFNIFTRHSFIGHSNSAHIVWSWLWQVFLDVHTNQILTSSLLFCCLFNPDTQDMDKDSIVWIVFLFIAGKAHFKFKIEIGIALIWRIEYPCLVCQLSPRKYFTVGLIHSMLTPCSSFVYDTLEGVKHNRLGAACYTRE